MYKPSDLLPPRGMRDFPPEIQILRRNIFNRIEKIFQRYGFDPIETPLVENWKILSGKYGEEAEKRLIWRFKLPYSDKEFGLRYDLTVPLARYVARFRPKLPFKRYHIGRVFRYEEPQKGRYREFWQCDVDIVGTESPIADSEVIDIISDIFKEFGFKNYIIKLNDRRLLRGIFEKSLGINSYPLILNIYRIIDKLDRIGLENVILELNKLKLSDKVIKEISKVINTRELGNEEIISFLERYDLNEVKDAVKFLNEILNYTKAPRKIKLDLSLVRGLDYYTGMIYEAIVTEPKIGSLSGGGRYDELISMFVGKRVPAVGGSIGVERLIDAGLELGIFTIKEKTYTKIGIIYSAEIDIKKVLDIASVLRDNGISVYVSYNSFKNIIKGIKDLVRRGIKYALIIGKREISSGEYTLQNLETRERVGMRLEEIIDYLKKI